MDKKIITYTKNGCPYCAAAKRDLIKKNILSEEINVSNMPEAKEIVVKLTGRCLVPVVVEGEHITVGLGGRG